MNWNVEEMKLLNEKANMHNKEKIYSCENIDRQEKIDFIDKIEDGKMSYLLNLFDKFESDKETLPKDNYGNVKTISLKAWLKKNDTLKTIDGDYKYGNIRFLGIDRWIANIDRKNNYDTYKDYVDECFHRVLKECEREEKRYFLEHDEYSILKQQLKDRDYHTSFGVNISEWSGGKVCIYDDNDNDNQREITIDELKLLLSKYEELDKLVEKITNEINIKY